jgi:Response regulator containing CheY-like receiver, AAA-type ATPase, and DNA-binding domains
MAKILIIEDDPNLRRGMNLRLRANGYETALAEDGISAVSVARTERPDLALVDIGLPGGDGVSVMRRLQNLASTAGMPMIVITGRDPLTAWPNAEALGAMTLLQKPVNTVKLLATIAEALGTTTARPAVAE